MYQPFEETCTTCGGAELRQERVRSAFWEGARLVVVEGVPAITCAACGLMPRARRAARLA